MKDRVPNLDTASPSASVDFTSTVTNSFLSNDCLNASQWSDSTPYTKHRTDMKINMEATGYQIS